MASKQRARNAKTLSPASQAPNPSPPLGFASLIGFAAFGLLCLLLVISPFLLSGFWPVTYDWQPQVTFLSLTACATLLLALRPFIEVGSRRAAVGEKRPIAAWLLLAFLGWCALSLASAVYKHDAFLELARISGCVAWFFIARELFVEQTRARMQIALTALVLGALIVCGLALSNFVQTRDIRQFGTFYNPNLFANYTAMALPLSFAWLLELWRSTRRRAFFLPAGVLLAGALAVCVVGAGLILTSSKGGFLSALGAMFVFTLAARRARGPQIGVLLKAHRRVVAIIVAVLIIGGGALSYKTVLPRLRAARTTDNNSTMFRAYTWKGTLHMAAARPLTGWGPGNFPVAYPRFAITGTTLSPHQSWLQIAAEEGAPALLLLIGACAWAARRAWQSLREANDHWLFSAGALGALAAMALHGLTDSGWGITSITLLLFFVLAFLDWHKESPIAHRPSPTYWFLATLALAAFAWSTQRAMNAEAARTESRKLISQSAPLAALGVARKAMQIDPLNARLWTHLAQVQEALGYNPEKAYHRALELQPTRAANWLNLADWLARDKNPEAGVAYDRAVGLDPNGTVTRLARAQWELEKGDATGWDDLEYIARLADAPYGRYPALARDTFVNLDFTRAYLKLAERDIGNGYIEKARNYLKRVETDLTNARKIEVQQAATRAALGVSYEGPPPPNLEEMEAQLAELRKQTQ